MIDQVVFASDKIVGDLALHDLASPSTIHTDYQAALCSCRQGTVVLQRPRQTGNACASCGGMSVQTGTCTTCTECGTTGGCG